ncbi:MAG TPA: FAD-dependent oxidoreductase, partial [Solirubrobacteraceae bacterium]
MSACAVAGASAAITNTARSPALIPRGIRLPSPAIESDSVSLPTRAAIHHIRTGSCETACVIERRQALAALAAEEFDVVVVGGGITGAGVALDAATRGYSVALVEKADFASGTSSRSSKLVHGGLRYLQNFDLGLVREALLERQINVNLAPHLVRPLRFVVPAFDGARLDRMMGVGLNAYDVMAVDRVRRSPLARRRGRVEPDWSPARHRVISGADVLELLPALADRTPTGGYLFYDCQTDDARLVLTVLAEAERF